MPATTLSLPTLRQAVDLFAGASTPDLSWAKLQTATAPAVDPGRPDHRRALLVWLNSWGCRIRYPRAGEADHFDAGVARWWDEWRGALPAAGSSIAELDEATLPELGECYAALAAVPVSGAPRTRTLGATAATKLLHALRPRALMPWDVAIAEGLHGRRDAAAYAAHQRLGGTWARQLLEEAGVDESALGQLLGRPGRPLAKMLDDYCYLVFTRRTPLLGRPLS